MPRSISVILVLVLTLAGCATQHGTPAKPRRAEPNEIPQFDRVTIVPQDTFTAVGRGESQGSRASKGTLGGALAGTAAGGLMGASACAATGPFAPACFAYYMSMGLLAGGVTGSLYGFTGMSREDHTAVNLALSRLSQQRNFQSELEQALVAASDGICVLNEEATVQLVSKLDTIEVKQSTLSNVRMVFDASLVFTWSDSEKGVSTAIESYRAESEWQALDDWLGKDGAAFGAAITLAIEQLAEQMSQSLFALQRKS